MARRARSLEESERGAEKRGRYGTESVLKKATMVAVGEVEGVGSPWVSTWRIEGGGERLKRGRWAWTFEGRWPTVAKFEQNLVSRAVAVLSCQRRSGGHPHLLLTSDTPPHDVPLLFLTTASICAQDRTSQ